MAWTLAIGFVLQSSYACVHTKTGLLGLHVAMLSHCLPLSKRSMQRLLRFRVACHKLPRDTGSLLVVPRPERFYALCQQGVSGDEEHFVLACPVF